MLYIPVNNFSVMSSSRTQNSVSSESPNSDPLISSPTLYQLSQCAPRFILYFVYVSSKDSLVCRDFPKPDLGPNIGPFLTPKRAKLPKMIHIIPNFLVLHFGENEMKI